ncbi:acetylcholine receptor subunit alpha [Coccinella septempunctata]|uniref:acetylcholine receptor subunit alpha n=1 Tax=Coccinella septempunctata TaxID=41139 RepID=UPI001D0833E9|nr:acetylcholine receptor subunit alpha [Coccinella septempunctata]
MYFSVLVFIFCIHRCYGIFRTTNETDLSSCKVYYSRSSTTYKDFFELQKPKQNGSNLRLDFHFSVLAASDAHILIATTKSPQKTDPAYEIVIGAGGNTFCDIRRMQKNQVKESVRIKGLLSGLDPRSFWIHMTKDGVLEVGREGEELSFMNWKDHDPLPVTTISFSTWPGIEAKWYFDCKTDDIKKIRRNLTDEEKLRRDLLNQYDPMVRPKMNESMATYVKMAPEINRITLDESKSVLHSSGMAHIMWKDEKLCWNKSAYGGITEIRVSSVEIWKPTLMVYNHFEEEEFLSDQSLLIVRDNGLVSWTPALHLKTWCASSSSQHNVWPKDRRNCDIIFTFLTNMDDLWIKYWNVSNTDYHNTEFSDWIIEEVDIYSTLSPKKDKNYLYFTVELKRNSEVYSKIFLVTYIVIISSILCSFCVSPFGPYKICLGCFQMVVSMLCVIYLAILLPAHSKAVPYIVRLHSYSIIGGVFSIILSIIVINLSRTEKEKQFPNVLSKILTSTIVKMIFCLPEVQRDRYGKLSTMNRMKDNQQFYILLGITIDRIALICGIALATYSIYLY